MKIPLQNVRVTVANRTMGTVLDRVITAVPGAGLNAVVRHQTGAAEYYGLTIRRKTMGDLFVTERTPGHTKHYDVAAGTTVHIPHLNDVYSVTSTPIETGQVIEAVPFAAPKASLLGRADGWLVTFHPEQRDCVLTLAIPPLKNEAIPSFPFPAVNAHKAASWLLPIAGFGAVAGGPVRLGVRGAGLAVTTTLPGAGQTRVIEPAAFRLEGAPNLELLAPAYVLAKYAEKAAMLTWY